MTGQKSHTGFHQAEFTPARKAVKRKTLQAPKPQPIFKSTFGRQVPASKNLPANEPGSSHVLDCRFR